MYELADAYFKRFIEVFFAKGFDLMDERSRSSTSRTSKHLYA